ncbi:uncharacterized protein [Hemitrygon akajei]|uniref:uncharacterized protein n=1 Tax=Hemitrygon akajei TaxID=2704970 RepID=UPI003BF98ACA
MMKQRKRQESLGKLGLSNQATSETKHKIPYNMLHGLNLNKATDKKNSLSTNHSAINDIDNQSEEFLSVNNYEDQRQTASSVSYQGNKNEWKEITPKKPVKLAPLELSEDIRKAQLEKLKDVQLKAEKALEKLATNGEICVENHPRKVRNLRQLENLEKIRQAEYALLENSKSSQSLKQQASFLPAKIPDSIINQKFGEKVLPNKLLVPITKSVIKSDGSPEPTHQAFKGRLRKGYEGEASCRSNPLNPF